MPSLKYTQSSTIPRLSPPILYYIPLSPTLSISYSPATLNSLSLSSSLTPKSPLTRIPSIYKNVVSMVCP